MVNIKDLARECGVNAATVSRALNGQKGVSEEKRDLIVATAKKMGYSKNPLASSLITHKSKLVGLVVPDITNPYYAAVAKGVSAVLEERGYSIFLCDCDRNRKRECGYFERLCNYRVEGVILISVTARERDLKIFDRSEIKVICVDNGISPRYSTIVNDNYKGACEITSHLIKCGVNRLVAVLGSAEANTTIKRQQGLLDTLEKAGKSGVLIKTLNIPATYHDALAAAPDILALKPDSIFAINDTVALGIFNYCQRHGVKVPAELKIAGYDDIPAASLISVPLTTVHQHKYTLGSRAAEELLLELENPATQPVRLELPPRLEVRESCGEKL